jgi:hypothetical protein
MNWLLTAIGNNMVAHWGEYSAAAGVIVLSAATTMPKPGTPLNLATLYQWVYETIQTALPVNRGPRPSTIPQPVPAALPVVQTAEPKPQIERIS